MRAAERRLADQNQAVLAELSRDKAQLTTILANIAEGIIAVDSQGRVIAANPALCALLSVDPASVISRPFFESIRHARLSELLSGVIKEEHIKVDEISIFSPDERLFEAHAVPLREGGRIAGALLVLHDITKLRHLERMRRDFVANVSHELRTPLASIRGFAETLRDGAVDDKEHRGEFLEEIEKGAEQLSALVDDLLDLSAIESGHRQPILEPVALLALAQETAATLRPLAERKKIHIEVVRSDIPHVRADRTQIRRVFLNLIENAVKYNKETGEVAISARVAGKYVEVSVSDTGSGIPEEDLPRVFERFYRVEKARSRELGGTGLGLAIVKHIVEVHSGKVTVESRLDEGSTFRFTLPA